MKQYLIIAQDANDAEALDRRQRVRPFHLEGAKQLKANNQFIKGGAILDSEGQMRGSVMFLQFESEEQFRDWYAKEPYITEGVWEQIEVKPFRVAEI